MAAQTTNTTADADPTPHQSREPRRLFVCLPYVVVGAVALLTRLIYLAQMSDSVLPDLLMGDAARYDAWAQQIAGGDVIGEGVFYQAPLYPYFLGLVYAVFGHSLTAVRLVQIVLGSAACVLLVRAGAVLLDRRTGWIAGLILAVYPTAVFFDGLIQKSALDLPLVCLILALLGGVGAMGLWRAAGLGVSAGLLVLNRENALPLVLVLAVWCGFASSVGSRRGRAARVALLAAGVLAVLMPVLVRNYAVGGEWHLTTSQFGPNFYIGNNPDADGTYRALRWGHGSAGYEQRDAAELAEAAAGRELTPGEVSAYWRDEALAYIRAQPGDWLALMGRKALLVWNSTEIGDTEDQYTWADESSLLRALGFVLHFGVLCPLAALGVWITWPKRRQLWPVYALTLTYAGSIALFYVFARYRYPLGPMVVLFAAAAFDPRWLRLHRERRHMVMILAVAAAAVVSIAANWPMIDVSRIRAATHSNIGVHLAQRQQYEPAIFHLEQALRWRPDLSEGYNNLGVVMVQVGELEQAVDLFREAVRLNPDAEDARRNLDAALGILEARGGGNPESTERE